MNVFFTGHVDAGFDAAKPIVEQDIKVGLGSFVSDYKLADPGYNDT